MSGKAELEGLLAAFMGLDNEARRAAEERWASIKKSAPDGVAEGLCMILSSTGETQPAYEGIRAMSAVLLRTLFGIRSDFWYRLQPRTQYAVREVLLRSVMEEPVRHIRLKVVHAIGQLASIAFGSRDGGGGGAAGGWPELLPLVTALCAHGDARHLEAGLMLVDKLCEYAHGLLAPHAPALTAIFAAALAHAESAPVRVAALRATASLLQARSGSLAHMLHASGAVIAQRQHSVPALLAMSRATAALLQALLQALACSRRLCVRASACMRALWTPILLPLKDPKLERHGSRINASPRRRYLLSSGWRDLNDDLTPAAAAAMAPLVPPMLAVVEAAARGGDEDAACAGLDALRAIADERPAALRPHLEAAARCALALAAASAQLRVATRQQALELLVALCESAPGAVRRSGAVAAIVPLVLDMLAQVEEDEDSDEVEWAQRADPSPWSIERGDQEENGDEDDDEVSNIAATALDRIALALGGAAVLSAASPLGCAAALYPQLGGVVPPVVARAARDVHPRVRYQLYHALGQMSADFSEPPEDGPNFQALFHAQVLPVLADAVGAANAGLPRLQAAAAATLTHFCHPEHCRVSWALPYAPALLTSLLGVIRSQGGGAGHTAAREEALTAVAQLAQVLGPGFVPFYAPMADAVKALMAAAPAELAQVLGPGFAPFYAPMADAVKALMAAAPAEPSRGGLLHGKALEALALMEQAMADPQPYPTTTDALPPAPQPSRGGLLRGKALEALALMGQAVGLELFRADAHAVLQALVSTQGALQPGDVQAPFSLMACARIAAVLRAEFRPYLPHVVPPLVAALSVDSAVRLLDAPDAALPSSSAAAAAAAQGVTAVECEVRGLGTQVLGINTAAMQEKKVALQVLYQYTADLGADMAPFARTLLEAVLPGLERANAAGVRVVSAAVVPKLLAAVLAAGASANGAGVRVVSAAVVTKLLAAALAAGAGADAQALLDAAVPALIAAMRAAPRDGENEETMECICVAADALCECLRQAHESGGGGGGGGSGGGGGGSGGGGGGSGGGGGGGAIALADAQLEPAVAAFAQGAAAGAERCTARAAAAAAAGAAEDEEEAEARAESQEQFDEWEYDMLTSCTDGLGWIVKARRGAALALYEAHALPTMGALASPPPQAGAAAGAAAAATPASHRALALCSCIDVAEHCGGAAQRHAPALLAAARAALADGAAADLRQAAAYGLGVLAAHGGEAVAAGVAACLEPLLAEAERGYAAAAAGDAGSGGAADNAVAAALRVCVHRGAEAGAARVAAAMPRILGWLPLRHDVAEGRAALQTVVELAESNAALVAAPACAAPLARALLAAMAFVPPEEEDDDDDDDEDEEGGGDGHHHHHHHHRGGACHEGHEHGAACCGGADEDADEMWERQFTTRELRPRVEGLLRALQGLHADAVGAAWAAADEAARRGAQTPTEAFGAQHR
ncbi:armadillo-type protein [Tribonema minus]|uniref:Armadillo-type protein n=1 Tax=Tribonema minus TaxID=303371 RepID=A0A835ZDS9_9STRA|nr:armadillo-type protein [Tribonema minus]